MSDLPRQIVWDEIVVGGYDTGMDLLIEVAEALDMASDACEAQEDAARLSALAGRVRRYLADSRPTTTLGMPRIPSSENRLSDESVIHRSGTVEQSHIRLLPN